MLYVAVRRVNFQLHPALPLRYYADEMFRWLLILILLLTPLVARAASPEEEQALKAASESFRLSHYERAEKDFADFVQKYPTSSRLAEAIFFQAEARLKQANYPGVISLLTTNLAAAGSWADKYLYCLGEAQLGIKAYDKAAETFGKLAKDFSASGNRLDAAYQEALAVARQGAWTNVIRLLQDTNGVFQTIAATNMGHQVVFQGYLLLSEAQLAEKNYPAALLTLDRFNKSLLQATNAWYGQHLRCRIQLAAGQLTNALQNAETLVVMASNTTQLNFQAESFAFKADVLERLGRRDEAINTYTNNLIEGIPTVRQREALFKTAELSLAQNRVAEAAQIIDRFLTQYPKIPSADLAWLSLGELRLRQYYDGSGAAKKPGDPSPALGDTNILAKAKYALLNVATNFSQTNLLGKSQMDLGWCYWLENNLVESEKQFYAALDRLPPSSDRAMTHFKLGDLQFRRGNSAGALTNYYAVIQETSGDPQVETNLFELALYQTVRAALSVTNFSAATNALLKLRAWYPESYRTEGAVLLTGQAVSRQDPVEAGLIYSDFLKVFPDAKLAPELQLAIARTYEEQNAWTNAIVQYETWLTRYTNHEARPRAEFYRALALHHNGDQTNAFISLTNFMGRFPTNDLAPLAQWWIADFYFDRGAYAAAETNYQAIAANYPKSELAFQASLKAGRAAVGRTSWDNAAKYYFRPLATNPACPPEVRQEAWFELGDATINQTSTNRIENYAEAIQIYSRAAEPTNGLGILAWGQIASCYLQWASSASQLTNAIDYFQRVINEPKADAVARSIAKAGIAIVLQKQAADGPPAQLLAARKAALNHYLDVFDRRMLRPGESPDAFWTRKAGLEAAQLATLLEQWEVAARIYARLIELMPELRGPFQERLNKALEKVQLQEKVARAN